MNQLRGLNPQQRQAVEHDEGPAIVIAGAGTGKTAVLTLRIANLILKHKVPQSQILALTFTEKAASEMQERVDLLLPYGYNDAQISTFHSLGDKILRAHSLELGLSSDFVVMSNFAQAIFISEILEEMGSKLKVYRPLGNPRRFVSGIARFISRLKDEAITAGDFSKFVRTNIANNKLDPDESRRQKELARIYLTYEKKSHQRSLIDYGDQILLCLQLLKSKPEVLNTLQQGIRYILVDEFQDTNFAQFELIKLLAGTSQNVMVVGDDDQAIYRFRGAAISNILSFQDVFPKAKKVVLQQNYRSGQRLLDSAYDLIQHNNPYRLEKKYRINKKLTARNVGKKPVCKILDSQIDETEYVAGKIKELRKSGYKYKDLAILIRKNSQAKVIVNSLSRHKIPFLLNENISLLEQPEIKALLHFVSSLNEPSNSQALYGLLTSEIYNFSMSELADASASAALNHEPLGNYIQANPDLAKTFAEPLQTILQYRELANQMSGGELLYDFLQHTSYLSELTKQSQTDSNAVRKVQNLTQLFELIREFDQTSYDPNIVALWQHLDHLRASEESIVVQASPLDVDAVRVLTVHRAKGLEFRGVFIVDAVELTFPSVNRADLIRMPDGLFDQDDKAINWHIMDERRLFYVAMTRSCEFLSISAAYNRGGKRLARPSRFIAEAIGENALTAKPQTSSISGVELTSFARLSEPKFDPLAQFYSNGWLHLSTNQVADYLRSPKEFWYFHVLHLPKGPFHALVYGTAMHAAIERYFSAKLGGQKITLNELYQTFEASWSHEGFVSLQHQKDRFEQGKATLLKFYKTQEKTKQLPELIEQPFVLRLPKQRMVVSGRYDAVYKTGNEIEISDFKTSYVSSKQAAQKRLRDSVQLAIYALAWEKNNLVAPNTISLQFVENGIVAKSPAPSSEKTIKILEKVKSGIKNGEFSNIGQSQINFERLV